MWNPCERASERDRVESEKAGRKMRRKRRWHFLVDFG
jgi:hypothetical protein